MLKLALLFLTATLAALPQGPPVPLDGPNWPFHDELLDNLPGSSRAPGGV